MIFMRRLQFITSYILLLLSGFLTAQSQKDSLNKLNFFSIIYESYTQNIDKPQIAKKYALEFKKKAVNLKMDEYICYGYLYLAESSEENKKIKYLDSIIYHVSSSLEQKPYIQFPEVAYYNKAYWYYKRRDFKTSLEVLLEGIRVASDNKKPYYVNIFKLLVGLIKSERINQEEDALKIVKEVHQYFEQQPENEVESEDYLSTILGLADIYRKLDYKDSATYYNKLGISKANSFKNLNYVKHFSLNEGMNQSNQGNPIAVIDSIKPIMKYLIKENDIVNLSLSHYFVGNAYIRLKNQKKAIFHYKIMDSIFQVNKIFNIEVRPGFEFLVNHYKAIDDKSEQLNAIETLMKLDSMYMNQYKNIRDLMDVKYDRMHIFKERDDLIKNLGQQKNKSLLYITSLSIITFLLLISTILYYQKQRVYKKRFDKIISSESSSNLNEITSVRDIGVPDKIVSHILFNLSEFEKKAEFLNPKISSHLLAEILDTNSKYLSKVINHHKGQSISVYINNLRIDYAIKKIKEDSQFRNYTIKAIGEEVGFNNPNSFSTAFERHVKLKPSYFIKRILNAPNS